MRQRAMAALASSRKACYNNQPCLQAAGAQTSLWCALPAWQSARAAPPWGRPSTAGTTPPDLHRTRPPLAPPHGPRCRIQHATQHFAPGGLQRHWPPEHLPRTPPSATATSTPGRVRACTRRQRSPAGKPRWRHRSQPYTCSARLTKASTIDFAMRSKTGPTSAANAALSKP